ncbi:MAG TPA: dihydrodipicolinate synthase family protein [Pseudomonadales bacterium]|nr:dihydrodipicolinate synthase family protein [Pseudomonadales bacterium]
MKKDSKYQGTVVPMVTPFTADGRLDEPSLDRLVDSLLAGKVEGIFVMGTTGEGVSIPAADRRRIVARTAARANGAVRIFAGISNGNAVEADMGNDYLRDGADALVLHPRAGMDTDKMLPWFQKILDSLNGPLLLYNMPMTTKVSIPLDVVEKLLGHSRLAGIKDSENNPQRLSELMKRFGGKKDFSVFVGVGAQMENGLKLGADGIVPSVGNLIPDVCHQLCVSAKSGDWKKAGDHFSRMSTVSALYQNGRTLNESLAALKAAMHCRGLCAPFVLPPLRPLSPAQLDKLRSEMEHLHLLNGKS